MKRILLASTAIVAFAGAAQAEIGFGASANMVYNNGGPSEGFDWDGEFDVNLSQELDNGLTAAADFGFEFADGGAGQGQTLDSKDFTLSMTSDTAGITFGDTAPAANKLWVAAGDMEQDGFSEEDGGNDMVLRGDYKLGDIDASVSYYFDDLNDELVQLSVAAAGPVGGGSFSVAYQAEEANPVVTAAVVGPPAVAAVLQFSGDYTPSEIFGVSYAMTLGGADVKVGYVTNETAGENSTGVSVSYPVSDAITVSGHFVNESNGDANMMAKVDYTDGPLTASVAFDDEQGTTGIDAAVTYDMGNGLSVFGEIEGEQDSDAFGVGATYDLGGGASLRATFVDASTVNGDNEYLDGDDPEGTTLKLSFTF